MSLTWKNGLLLFLAVITASAVGCVIAHQFSAKAHISERNSQLHAHAHEVLQRDLGLSSSQVTVLEEIEKRFLDREAALKEANAAAVAKLADALERDRAYSPEVAAAISQIHQTQGEIQKATIEHLLEMEPVLTPQQYDHLVELVARALRNPPDPSRR